MIDDGSPRILQLGSGMPGWAGTERHVIDLTLALRAAGRDVTVGCAPGSVFETRCRELDVPQVPLEMRHTRDWRRVPSFVRAFRGRYDVVHVHGFRDYVFPALAARIARTPAVIMTRHLPHPFQSAVTARACAHVFYDHVIAVSSYIAGVMEESGFPAEKITVVRNGIDPPEPASREALRREFGVPDDALLVASAGRVTPTKGFEVLLEAVEGLDRAWAIVFGDGDAREALRRRFDGTGRIHLPGFRKDVEALWSAADAVVVPSVSPEALSYVALEGMAAGRPIVASRIGGIPELGTEASMILFPPGDVDRLRDALAGLLEDPARREAMGRAARERVRDFSRANMVRAVEGVYRRVLKGDRP